MISWCLLISYAEKGRKTYHSNTDTEENLKHGGKEEAEGEESP
jgi:hypothetical protein